jgi:hypothetical protein
MKVVVTFWLLIANPSEVSIVKIGAATFGGPGRGVGIGVADGVGVGDGVKVGVGVHKGHGVGVGPVIVIIPLLWGGNV